LLNKIKKQLKKKQSNKNLEKNYLFKKKHNHKQNQIFKTVLFCLLFIYFLFIKFFLNVCSI